MTASPARILGPDPVNFNLAVRTTVAPPCREIFAAICPANANRIAPFYRSLERPLGICFRGKMDGVVILNRRGWQFGLFTREL